LSINEYPCVKLVLSFFSQKDKQQMVHAHTVSFNNREPSRQYTRTPGGACNAARER
jgi:hypothetical protein